MLTVLKSVGGTKGALLVGRPKDMRVSADARRVSARQEVVRIRVAQFLAEDRFAESLITSYSLTARERTMLGIRQTTWARAVPASENVLNPAAC